MSNDYTIPLPAPGPPLPPPVAVIFTPGEIHAGYSPCVFTLRGTAGKLYTGWLSGMDFDAVPLRIYFYDSTIRWDIGPQLRSILAAREPGDSVSYNIYVADAAGSLVWIASGTAVPSVVQVGEGTDLTPLVGATLSGFDRLLAWDGYPRDYTILQPVGGTRRINNACMADVCSIEYADFVPRLAVSALGADAATALGADGTGATALKISEI